VQEPESGLDILNYLNDNVAVILVGTTHAGNIGAVARAMKNMGLSDLRLVSPQDFPSDEAVSRSAGAVDIIENVKVFDSLAEALKDRQHVVGASARVRSFPWPIVNPRVAAEDMLDLISTNTAPIKVGYVFGRESSGLTNEELQQCNSHVNIPANPSYSSLNLAMAVQVITYELRMTALQGLDSQLLKTVRDGKSGDWDEELSSQEEVGGMLDHLTRVMVQTGFYDPDNPGQLLPRLRRLFQRRHLDKMEVNILRGILKSVEKTIK